MMAGSDLDPLFIKALKLLQSRSKESRYQLRQLYDEVVAERKGELAMKQFTDDDPPEGKLSRTQSGNHLKKEHPDVIKKRELEKANFEKLKQELAELSQEVPVKKPKLDSSNLSSSGSNSPRMDVKDRSERSGSEKSKSSLAEAAKEKPRERLREIEEDIFFGPTASLPASNRAKERERLEREEKEKALVKQKEKEAKERKDVESSANNKLLPISSTLSTCDDTDSDTEVSSDDTVERNDTQTDHVQDDDAMDEMQFELLGSLSCVVCKTLTVTSSNRLVECQECHSLYHQDCHKPPVTDNVNDPRFVWYCSKCVKNLKKIVIKNQKKPSAKPNVAAVTRESPVFKPSKPDLPVVSQPFKRIEPTKLTVPKEALNSTTVQSGCSGAGRGLAQLAANLNSRPPTAAGSSSSSQESLRSKTVSDVAAGGNSSAARGFGASQANRVNEVAKSSSQDSRTAAAAPGWGTVVRTAVPPTTAGKTDATNSVKSFAAVANASAGKPVVSSSTATSAGVGANASAGNKMSQSTLMNADKRLQIMKKKAAAKMAEKRTR